ncbi:unnamed protein product [Musa acuminata subsp. malaccensis]|uniref:(wild Malaysian banana) hypothetical protein n=1 Tax=Musa acuminata subsp. malaccensis TaxID=214687 RepID=A0A804JR29_MUSAM|nr:unnamed protein product [Musa acuminata subsp. malaccensis]
MIRSHPSICSIPVKKTRTSLLPLKIPLSTSLVVTSWTYLGCCW